MSNPMAISRQAGSLLEQARGLALAKFNADQSGKNKDKVCAVAISVVDSSAHFELFSGAPGYGELTGIVMGGGASKQSASQLITHKLTQFLGSEEGGGFSNEQITRHGYDAHGRGAMNCAEPKMYYLLKEHEAQTVRNWVVIPFNYTADQQLVYNAPCKNCRRWVYRHFHPLSGLIARAQKGPEAFEA
ncbi:hypothetical protein [Eleftheria terrae]|uniref:hypothetical protein n=1 Tax=Eleftheria terrae TaxID=1597781 RepID=UPI00263B9C82|nr:hypothetical protein [Eleftheria terrae]WKB55512.1 hypothetical protein N7L95_25895 [Eleftheria terrae]